MADRIKGITIELNGDTTKLSKALQGVNKEVRNTQNNLKDVNKLLKMDPGNADLLAQKQKYLTDAIDATKRKLAEEKEALAQLKAGPQTAETQKQQEALTREIEATTQSLEGLEDEYKSFGSVAGQQLQVAGEKIKAVGDKISDVGEGLTKGITLPVAAAGAASVAAWKEVDEALDTVTEKTGASGAALEDMQNRAKSIAETIPTDFQTAADAIGEVNTRFGLTGDALETLSTQFVEFATLNDTDVSTSVDNVSAVLKAFGQDTSDAGNLLDALNQTGQATGVSMDTLSQDLAKNAGQFQAMGLTAEQAAGFMGAVEMSGLDTSTMLTGLTKAQKAATKDGQTLDEALKGFSETMSSNASETDKLQAAYDLFGSRAGGAIYNAVQTGKLNLADLSSTLGNFSGSVESTFNETLDPLDQMTVVMNNLKDIGAEIVDAAAPMITEAMSQVKDVITGLKDAWDSLSPSTQEAIVKAALIAAAVGPVVVGVGKVVSAVGSVISVVGKLAGFITGTVVPAIAAASVPILPIIAIIAGVVAAVIAVIEIVKHWGEISEWFQGVWESVCDAVKSVGQTLADFFSGLWEGIRSTTETAWNGIADFFTGIWDGITGVFTTIGEVIRSGWETVTNAVSVGIQFIAEILSAAGEILLLPWTFIWENFGTEITAAWEKIKSVVSTALDAIKSVIETVWNAIVSVLKPILDTIASAVSTAWDAVKTATETVFNAVFSFLGTIWSGISTAFTTVLSAIQTAVQTAWNAISTVTSTVFNAVKTVISNIWNGIKSTVSSILNGIKGVFTTVWNGIKSAVTGVVNGISTTISSVFNGIKNTATSVWNGIKSAIVGPVEAARDAVHNAIEKMKGFFHFSWSLPHLKLPHFSIAGRFSLDPPSVPHFSIRWYKKAMDDAYLLNSPTIFGASGGRFLGGGEAGQEAIVGTGKLMSMISDAAGQDAAVQAISDLGNELIALMRQYFPQMANQQVVLDSGTLVGSLAPKMNQQLGRIAGRRARG